MPLVLNSNARKIGKTLFAAVRSLGEKHNADAMQTLAAIERAGRYAHCGIDSAFSHHAYLFAWAMQTARVSAEVEAAFKLLKMRDVCDLVAFGSLMPYGDAYKALLLLAKNS